MKRARLPSLRGIGACAVLLVANMATGAAAGEQADAAGGVVMETLELAAPAVSPTPLRVRIHLPPGHGDDDRARDVLYLDDGQDAEAVGLAAALAALAASGAHAPIVVAIDMPPDRMSAYGLSDRAARHGLVAQTRYGPVGARAHAYSEWLAHVLVPAIDARHRTRAEPAGRAVLGWSLGGLHAFNMGWQYPDTFGVVGAFSPSFWISADRADTVSVQASRLAQRMVDAGPARPGLRVFLAVGETEETDDRDGDGRNDALDDTLDFALGDGCRRGLAQLGYTVSADHARHPRPADVAVWRLPDGRHHQDSWARMLPAFLQWAWGRDREAGADTAAPVLQGNRIGGTSSITRGASAAPPPKVAGPATGASGR